MARVMMTFQWSEGSPTVEAVCAHFGFQAGELDASFGVVEIDPADHTFTVLVDAQAAERVSGKTEGLSGPFANPEIAPMGPPAKSSPDDER